MFSLPTLKRQGLRADEVGLSEAMAASFAYLRAGLRDWLPFAALATALDIALAFMGIAGVGGLIFSVWYLRRLVAGAEPAGGFARRLISTVLAQVAGSLLILLALLPSLGVLVASVPPSSLPEATDPSALTAMIDLLDLTSLLIGLALLLPPLYLALRLSQGFIAAIVGKGPIEANRISFRISAGSLWRILAWSFVLGLLASAFGALVATIIAGLAGATIGASTSLTLVAVLVANALYAPFSLGVSLTLYERLSATR